MAEKFVVGGNLFPAGAHAPLVVLAHEHKRKLPDPGQVEGLVEGALVDGAVPEEADRGALRSLARQRPR